MKRDDLREVIARAICRVQLNGGDPDQPAVRWNGTEMEPQSFPAWRDYTDEAEHALSALDAAGMKCVPKEPTDDAAMRGVSALRDTCGDMFQHARAKAIYRAMIAVEE